LYAEKRTDTRNSYVSIIFVSCVSMYMVSYKYMAEKLSLKQLLIIDCIKKIQARV